MIRLQPGQVTPELRALFDPGEPAGLRCFAILEGTLAGAILADRLAQSTWAVVQEGMNGSIYLGGRPDVVVLQQVVAELRRSGDVLIGLWPDDPRWALLPPNPDYEGSTLEWHDRPLGQGLEPYLRAVPPGCAVRPMDAEIFSHCEWYEATCREFGSAERFFQEGLGFCLLQGDTILCEAYAGPAVQGVCELGVLTHEAYRGLGYATITCAHMVQACEALGYQTYWNTAKQNLASAAVARKLGYRVEREYRLLAWNQT